MPRPESTENANLSKAQNTLVSKTQIMVDTAHGTKANDEKFLVMAMEEAAKTMSKSLQQKENLHESWLLHQLATLCTTQEATPKQHLFQFDNSRSSAKFNTKLIKHSDYDLDKCLNKQKHTILSPGSEFRNIKHIKKLLQHHEDWKEIRDIISKGCDYQLGPDADEETRRSDLKAMLARGNHKSAIKNIETLQKAFTKEVKKGWLLPVTIESLTKIKHLSIIPLGIADQLTIDEFGNKKPKKRVTHDASFPAPSGRSVNNTVIEGLLQDCIYGQCLRRILNCIHNLRFHNMNKRIYMTKYDMDAAYRRLHALTKHALKCTTVLGKIAYIPLRLPFGVSPGPSLYSTISECVFDLTNDLLNEKSWDRSKLNSPYAQKLIQAESPNTTSEIKTVRKLDVYIPNRLSFADGYIDDCLAVAVDVEDEIERSQQAPPLIIHSLFRPLDKEDPAPRNDNISDEKLKGEGQPSERRIMLGWLIDTTIMRVFLPITKAQIWSEDINQILKSNSVNTKMLESTIGRLNHVGYILPTGRYFLNRLRHLLSRCERYGKQQIQKFERDDLLLWLKFLDKASMEGISTDNITFTEVTSHIITDACEFGLGGFNMDTGKAWRYKLPSWMTATFHINLLEFIASVVAIWLDIIDDNGKTEHKKYFALTDNSSTVGWLYKSNFHPKTHPGHDVVARKLASILMESESSLDSQHVKGKHNVVADALSRDHHIESTHLEFILKTIFPTQTPKTFKINQTLPTAITSWLDSLKGISTTSEVLTPRHTKSNVGTLFAGKSSWKEVVSMTNSLINLKTKQKTISCQLTSRVLEEIKMVEALNHDLKEIRSPPPSTTYVRPFGRTFGGIRL